MFGHADNAGPRAALRRHLDMLRAHANRRRVALGGFGAFDEVHFRRADEPRHELIARVAVELQRAAHLLNHARLEDDDLVGHRHRLHLIVGDVDHRRGELLVQLRDFHPHPHAQGGVEV